MFVYRCFPVLSVPEVPTSTEITSVTTDSMTISFSYDYDPAVAQCTHYHITWSDETHELEYTGGTHEYTIDGLDECTDDHTVTVKAVTKPNSTEWIHLDDAVGEALSDNSCTCEFIHEK